MGPPVVTTLPDGGRIGLLADTHCERAGRRLPAGVFDTFAGVELILHLGDCGDAGALDELGRVAPVVATRGGDDAAGDARYADRRVVRAGSLAIGALFDLSAAGIAVADGRLSVPAGSVGTLLATAFEWSPDVVVFAATHAPLVAHYGGVLFVNPGSATLPARPGFATIAVLDVKGSVASVEVVRMRRARRRNHTPCRAPLPSSSRQSWIGCTSADRYMRPSMESCAPTSRSARRRGVAGDPTRRRLTPRWRAVSRPAPAWPG
jgi:hypothetical protein